MVLMAGYHATLSSAAPTSAQDLQKSRLLYRTYILDQDLSLRLGKPPLLTESLIVCLPDKRLEDCLGVICLPGGTTVNCLREQVAVARIQNRAWEGLRSPSSYTKSSEEFLDTSNRLLEQLRQWKDSLPASIIPPARPTESGNFQQMQITDIHWIYFQTVIAIHSAIFTHPLLFSDPAVRDQSAAAVGQCAGAVRELLALAKRLNYNHPLAQ